jgi:hypothetical protein
MLANSRVLRLGVPAAVGAMILAATLTSGGAAAQSRAAHRWNHDSGVRHRTSAEPILAGGRTLILDEIFTNKFTFIDVGERGKSPGDYGVFRDPLADPDTGKHVGTIDVQCIAAYADQCRGSIRLIGRGQIVFDGITPVGVDPDRFAVTGGTGVFAKARGLLVVSFPSEDSATLTLRLFGV